MAAHPEWFESGWEGQQHWIIEGVGTFESNPADLVSAEDAELVRLYRECDRGMMGHVWPDGRALLDQPNALVTAFAVIGNALERARKKG